MATKKRVVVKKKKLDIFDAARYASISGSGTMSAIQKAKKLGKISTRLTIGAGKKASDLVSAAFKTSSGTKASGFGPAAGLGGREQFREQQDRATDGIMKPRKPKGIKTKGGVKAKSTKRTTNRLNGGKRTNLTIKWKR